MSPQEPLGLGELDALHSDISPALDDYIRAASEYVLQASGLSAKTKKAAQIRLSAGLGRCLEAALSSSVPPIAGLRVGEHDVGGALRVVKVDLSEMHRLDGLRLAVEIKPVNLAVGRAIWNRFGDIRTFAVNLHLKFPFAVVGGLLTIPTVETDSGGQQKSTTHLIERAVRRLVRAGGRRNEGDAAHLLEAVGVVVYDPNSATVSDDFPGQDSGLRWDDFVMSLATAYDSRFE